MNRIRTASGTCAAAALATGFLTMAPAPASAAGSAAGREECEPAPYTVMDDYVRVLLYWHHNLDWNVPPRP